MSSAASSGLAGLAGVELGTRRIEYSVRDVMLYALAVGAGADELDLVYEKRLRVLPTYGLALGLWAVEAAGELGAYDRLRSLHAAQTLRVHAPLPPAGRLATRACIGAVWDKGKAAMVEVIVGCEQFSATYSIFLPGLGGWGGNRGPTGSGHGADADADDGAVVETVEPTSLRAAALYRLTGDLHPVHIDPKVAADYGFQRPILHGLCTLGIAARSVAAVGGAHPCDLVELSARFAAPVLPGDELVVRAARADGGVGFTVVDRDVVVLAGGRARFAAA